MDQPAPKPLVWIADTKGVLRAFPKPVRTLVGAALSGFGDAGVLEVLDDFDGNTYRAVYTVRFAGLVYVLHVFQKKSKRGIATPRHEMEVIRAWRMSSACTR